MHIDWGLGMGHWALGIGQGEKLTATSPLLLRFPAPLLPIPQLIGNDKVHIRSRLRLAKIEYQIRMF